MAQPSQRMSPPEDGDARADAADRALGLEARQPGQNVFAQREIARHRQLLQGNAWYQEAFLEKLKLPPETIHPAFRTPGLSMNTQFPIPTMPMPEEMREEQEQRRRRRRRHESSNTTMSPFIGAGQQPSPVINLHTTPEIQAVPTLRAYCEERTEQRQHEASGSTAERIPVFHPTPKPDDEAFQPLPHSTQKNSEVRFAESDTKYSPTKFSPEKKAGFFSRFRGKRSSDVTSTAPTSEQGQRIPVKAQAVLGAKHTNSPLRRSTSKKAFFSRRSSDAASSAPTSHDDLQRPSTSMGFAGGASRKSSQSSKRIESQAGSDSGRSIAGVRLTPIISRSKSLKYADSVVPPTPPLKDTPPDVKAIRDVTKHDEAFVPFTNKTPTQSAGFLSTTQRVSPTNNGTHATRNGARLVTAPSMHSMHASVHISNFTHEDKEQLKHIDALGIAGWNDEKPPQVPYSPSVYSPDAFRASIAHFPSTRTIIEDDEEVEEAQPHMAMKPPEPLRRSVNTEDTTCTSETIHIYREIERDESLGDLYNYDGNSLFSSSTNTRPMEQTSPTKTEDEMLATPKAGNKSGRAASKQPVTPLNRQTNPPMSPMSHASAQVSPLRLRAPRSNAVPPTAFTPQSKVRRKAMDHDEAEGLAAARREQCEDSPVSDIFANKPVMTPEGITPAKRRSSPQPNTQSGRLETEKNVESAVDTTADSAHDSGVEYDEQMKPDKKKRVSTTHARDFYRSPQTQTASTPSTEAPTIIETPNMPSGMTPQRSGTNRSLRSSGVDHHRPRTSSNGRHEQEVNASDTVAHPRTAITRNALATLNSPPIGQSQGQGRVISTGSLAAPAAPGISPMEQHFLMSMIQQQNSMMSQMMGRMERMEAELANRRTAINTRNDSQEEDHDWFKSR